MLVKVIPCPYVQGAAFVGSENESSQHRGVPQLAEEGDCGSTVAMLERAGEPLCDGETLFVDGIT